MRISEARQVHIRRIGQYRMYISLDNELALARRASDAAILETIPEMSTSRHPNSPPWHPMWAESLPKPFHASPARPSIPVAKSPHANRLWWCGELHEENSTVEDRFEGVCECRPQMPSIRAFRSSVDIIHRLSSSCSLLFLLFKSPTFTSLRWVCTTLRPCTRSAMFTLLRPSPSSVAVCSVRTFQNT